MAERRHFSCRSRIVQGLLFKETIIIRDETVNKTFLHDHKTTVDISGNPAWFFNKGLNFVVLSDFHFPETRCRMNGTHCKLQFMGTVEFQFSSNVKIADAIAISQKKALIILSQIL